MHEQTNAESNTGYSAYELTLALEPWADVLIDSWGNHQLMILGIRRL